jgi:hypothetical protein
MMFSSLGSSALPGAQYFSSRRSAKVIVLGINFFRRISYALSLAE